MRCVLPLGVALLAAPSHAERIDAPEAIPPADIVILGEIHDNPAHHAFQAEAVAALAPKAVVWEMLSPDAQVDAALAPDALRAALDWDASGWPDFSLYAPIFAAAPDAAHLGMALPRDAVRRAITEGGAAVMGEGAARLGLDRSLALQEAAARAQLQQDSHCGMLPEEMLPGFVEAQRLRDAGFAAAVLEALERYGPPVAVITGSGHARADWGMPVYLAAAAPEVTVTSVGALEADDPEAPFDVWIVADAPERTDPCEAFR